MPGEGHDELLVEAMREVDAMTPSVPSMLESYDAKAARSREIRDAMKLCAGPLFGAAVAVAMSILSALVGR